MWQNCKELDRAAACVHFSLKQMLLGTSIFDYLIYWKCIGDNSFMQEDAGTGNPKHFTSV